MVRGRPAQLAKWQIWLLSISGGLLWLSGVVWLLLHHYGQTKGEFGPEANPFEPWMMRLHGLVLIPALLGIGGMLVAHIPRGWRSRPQRLPGGLLSALLAMLIVSGYLLYYVGDETVRGWTSAAHWLLGLGLPVLFLWHFVNGRRKAQRRRSSRQAGNTPGKGAIE